MESFPPVTIVSSNKTYLSARAGRLYVVDWRADPDSKAFENIQAEVSRAAREIAEVIYVGISGDINMPSSGEEQSQLVKSAIALFQTAGEAHLVLRGTTLKSTITRTIVRGMVFAARMGQRVAGIEVGATIRKVTVHDSIDGCLNKIAGRLGTTSTHLKEQFVRVGIV